MFGLPISLIIDLFLLLGAGVALWKGGSGERAAAIVVLANVAAGRLAHAIFTDGEALIRLSIDGLSALALLFITVRYASLWLGGVMLFFAAQFSLFSFYLVTNRGYDYLHALVNNLNWAGVTWCLIIGTAVAWRRRSRKQRPSGSEVSPSQTG